MPLLTLKNKSDSWVLLFFSIINIGCFAAFSDFIEFFFSGDSFFFKPDFFWSCFFADNQFLAGGLILGVGLIYLCDSLFLKIA